MVRERRPRPPERHGEQRGERHLRHGVGGLPLCAGFHEGRHAGLGLGRDAPCRERYHDDDHDERGLSRRMLDDVRYHEEDDLCDHALYHELGYLSDHLSGHVSDHLSGHVSGRLSGHLFRRVSSHVPGRLSRHARHHFGFWVKRDTIRNPRRISVTSLREGGPRRKSRP